MRIISVDLGNRYTGFASCDELEMTVSPLHSIEGKSTKQIVEEIISTARRMNADEVIIGLPLNMNGTSGKQAEHAEKIAAAVAESGVQVRLWDERLTSWEADQLLLETGKSAKKRRLMAHSAAAAVILRSYIDSKKEAS